MSYDLTMNHHACWHCGRGSSSEDWNITGNLGGVFRWALDNDNGLFGLDGLGSAETVEPLRAALARLKDDSNEAIINTMLPSNGWGTRDSAIRTIEWALRQAESAEDHGVWTVMG